MTDFAELCAQTNFSLLQGASRPEEMVARANELGLWALAIADRNGLYGSVRAHCAAAPLHQRYIVGAELDLTTGAPSPADSGPRSSAQGGLRGVGDALLGRAILLTQHEQGYHNLCRILTRAHADLPREKAALDPNTLAQYADGLVLILDLPSPGRAGRSIHPVGSSFPQEAIRTLGSAYAKRIFLASVREWSLVDGEREAFTSACSARFAIPMVATARPRFHRPERKSLADVLTCIREKTTLDEAGDRLASNAEAYLHSAEQMARLFRDAPDRVERSVEIASSCHFSLAHLHYSFPCDDIAPGESPDQLLSRLVEIGARKRYTQGVPASVRAQLDHELVLIARLKVAQFFLSVYDVVKIARDRGILCQGRGSAANSAVCFVLGITAVDPEHSNLLFERFLSTDRGEPPDIDVDFEHERREEVIQAIYQKYGRDRAAMVSEVITYRGRSALRETSKAFGLSLEQANRLASTIGPYDGIDSADAKIANAGFDPEDRRIQLVFEMATQLQGFPRHMSTHVGGFVLSARPICEVSPVEPAKIPGRTVVPWDKDDIDALGFFKVDVLGLGMLTAIRKAMALVHEQEPSFDPIAELARIPADDPEVYAALCKADTIGVFQVESRAQMAMLPRIHPERFYDLVIEVAIVRPGPIHGGMVHPYLRRRNHEEPIDMPHPSLTPILERTLGVPLFQEQVMQIAMVGAGYSPGEADELRRDMAAWRRNGRLMRHREKLLRGFAKRGIPAEFAERLFQQIQGFGEYGFPESHAASFALLVYASAWLKTHHSAEFACALLNSQPMGFYSPSSIVRDAQKHGVVVLSPDVAASFWDSTLARSKPPVALQLGLRLVKGIGEEAANAIARARSEAAFRDVKDLAVRSGLRSDQVEALAEAGALESLVVERREAMWQARAPDTGRIFEHLAEREPAAGLPRLSETEKLCFDYQCLGLSVPDHPMRHLRASLEKRGVVRSEQLPTIRHGAAVRVAGLVLSRQRPATASGIVFVTLEDETGMINLILRAQVFERFHDVAVRARLVLARGTIERTPRAPLFERITPAERTPVIHVLVRSLEELVLPTAGALQARSRDFH